MSQFTQIDVRLLPLYGTGGFPDKFPNLARLLRNYGYTRVLEEEPSLFHMVDVLTRLRNDPQVSQKDKGGIIRMHSRFEKTRDQAREQLLARNLNDLDRTLYQLEDLFAELEKEFDW